MSLSSDKLEKTSTGIFFVFSSAFNFAKSSKPSVPGKRRSSKIISGVSLFNIRSALSLFSATSTSYPLSRSFLEAMRWRKTSSSIIKIFFMFIIIQEIQNGKKPAGQIKGYVAQGIEKIMRIIGYKGIKRKFKQFPKNADDKNAQNGP